jgi:hypothetical protein
MAEQQSRDQDETRTPTHSPGIPASRRPGEPDTGDPYTATSEGADTAGAGLGSPVMPPAEGGLLHGPTRTIEEEEADV